MEVAMEQEQTAEQQLAELGWGFGAVVMGGKIYDAWIVGTVAVMRGHDGQNTHNARALAIARTLAGHGGDLTQEQVQCARLRAELEAARVEGTLSTLSCRYSSEREDLRAWCVYLCASDCHKTFDGHTELAALTAAAEYVRGLRQPVLPDVEGMDENSICAELNDRGWEYIESGGNRGYIRGETFLRVTYRDIASHRAALTRAREIDAAAGAEG